MSSNGMTRASLEFHLAKVDPKGEMSQAERLKAAEDRHRTFAINGRIGALDSWGNTVDRTARTAPGHSKSPASLEFHLATVDPEGLMDEETRLKAAKAKHKAHMQRLARKSAETRRIKAARLRGAG